MTDLYFSGAEIPGWRTLLRASGVRHQALSYIGLSRRVKFVRPWLIAEKFGPDVNVLLDSGTHTLNKSPDVKDQSELLQLATNYASFVELNADAIALGVEFDAVQLPPEARRELRDRLHEILSDRFLPVWHGEDGLDELYRLADTYGRVGITQTVFAGRDLIPTLRTLARTGILLHGVAMTKPDLMEALPWSSVASTSWLSPSMYGDTIVWTGGELKRYPRKYKDQSRLRHRTLFTNAGFDAEAIANDDTTEVLKLSIWSWNEFMHSLNRQTPPAYQIPLQMSIPQTTRNTTMHLLIRPPPKSGKTRPPESVPRPPYCPVSASPKRPSTNTTRMEIGSPSSFPYSPPPPTPSAHATPASCRRNAPRTSRRAHAHTPFPWRQEPPSSSLDFRKFS